MTDHIGDGHLVTPSPTPSRDVLADSQTDGGRKCIDSEDYFYPSQSSMPQQSGHNGYHHKNRLPAQLDRRYLTPEPRAYSPFAQDRQATATPPIHRGVTPNASPTPNPDLNNGRQRGRLSTPIHSRALKVAKVAKRVNRRNAHLVPLPVVSFSEQLSQAAWNAVKAKTTAHIQRSREIRQTDQVNKKGSIKRPWNTYVIYRWAFSSLIKTLYPGSGQQDISRVASCSWKLEPSEVKDFFGLMANKEKVEHKKAFPRYSYQPNKPNDALNAQQARATSASLETDNVEWQDIPRRFSRSISCGPVITDVPRDMSWYPNELSVMPSIEETFYDRGPVPLYLDAPPMQTFAHDTQIQDSYEKSSINPSLLHDGPHFIAQSTGSAYPPVPPADHLMNPYFDGQYVSEHSLIFHDGVPTNQGYSVADTDSSRDPDMWDLHYLSYPNNEEG